MLFFIDESWQTTNNEKYKVGILAAVQMKSHDYNECSKQIYTLKSKHLGILAGNKEIKGNGIFRKAKELEYKSRALFSVDGKQYSLNGFKVIKEKEAGDLFSSGRTI